MRSTVSLLCCLLPCCKHFRLTLRRDPRSELLLPFGVARLVMLPGEAHGYTARENLLHMLAEEIDWLDAHVRKPSG